MKSLYLIEIGSDSNFKFCHDRVTLRISKCRNRLFEQILAKFTLIDGKNKNFNFWPILQGTPLWSQKSRFQGLQKYAVEYRNYLFFQRAKRSGSNLLPASKNSRFRHSTVDIWLPRNRKNRTFPTFEKTEILSVF